MRIIILAWLLTLLSTTCFAQGLSDFNGLTENLSKRTYNQKAYDLGDKKTRYRIHTRQLHYKDNRGDFKDIDTSLKFNIFTRKWTHRKASYHPVIPEYADGWFEFYNAYKGANHTIKARPIAKHVKGTYFRNKPDGNYVLYKNAFGQGIDLKVYSYWGGLKKVIVINNKPVNTSKNLTFDFELSMPTRVKDRAGSVWNRQSKLRFKDKTLKIGLGGKESYFKNARVWDSGGIDGINSSVNIELYIKNNKIYLRKTITTEQLNNAAYPLYTDHPTVYYAGSGDGRIANSNTSTWALARSSAGTGADDTSASTVVVQAELAGVYYISRCFFPVDTSGITDGDTVTAATFYLYDSVGQNTAESTYPANLALVSAPMVDSTSLANGDWDNMTTTRWADTDVLLSNFAFNDNYQNWVLNTTGKTAVNKTGYTNFGIRASNDFSDSTVPTARSYAFGYYSEQTGTSNDPYLDVTTSAGSTFTPKIIFF